MKCSPFTLTVLFNITCLSICLSGWKVNGIRNISDDEWRAFTDSTGFLKNAVITRGYSTPLNNITQYDWSEPMYKLNSPKEVADNAVLQKQELYAGKKLIDFSQHWTHEKDTASFKQIVDGIISKTAINATHKQFIAKYVYSTYLEDRFFGSYYSGGNTAFYIMDDGVKYYINVEVTACATDRIDKFGKGKYTISGGNTSWTMEFDAYIGNLSYVGKATEYIVSDSEVPAKKNKEIRHAGFPNKHVYSIIHEGEKLCGKVKVGNTYRYFKVLYLSHK